MRDAHGLHIRGDGAAGVLIQAVGGIGGALKICSTGVSALAGGCSIADVIKAILMLLPCHRGAILPVSFPTHHLPQLIVVALKITAKRATPMRESPSEELKDHGFR